MWFVYKNAPFNICVTVLSPQYFLVAIYLFSNFAALKLIY